VTGERVIETMTMPPLKLLPLPIKVFHISHRLSTVYNKIKALLFVTFFLAETSDILLFLKSAFK
jgi:hypothetical protein